MRVQRSRAPTGELKVLGVDSSLTSTGIAWRGADGEPLTDRIKTDGLTGPYRLSYARRRMEKILDLSQARYIALEDYAMGVGAGRGRTFHIGELGGVYKTLFWERGLDILLISPSTLKMGITGNGAAKGKKLVHRSILEKFGYNIEQNDEADAFGLMILGEIRTGVSPLPVEVRQSMRIHNLFSHEVISGSTKLIANPRGGVA